MNTTAKKGELFLKEVLNRLKGDDDAALANKITRKAISALESQCAGLKAKIVDDEILVENSTENVASAIYPTKLFEDNKTYCNNIVKAQEKLDLAIDNLNTTKESLDYFQKLLDSI